MMIETFSQWLEPIRAQLPANLSPDDLEPLTEAISQEAANRFSAFLAGISFYQNADIERAETEDVEILWTSGTTELLDYKPGSNDPVVLVIPSLINRFEILDLDQDHSFLRFLADQGFHPLVLNWNEPGDEEKTFDVSAYLQKRLIPTLEIAQQINKGKPCHVFGYCMGGLLALALCLLRPKQAQSLTLMATPWDFKVKGVGGVPPAGSYVGDLFLQAAKNWMPNLEPLGALPTLFLQAIFTGFQPLHILQKFSRYASTPPSPEKARRFILTEDWLSNGIPLAMPVVRECLHDWYENNMIATLQWKVAEVLIDPRKLDLPTYLIIPLYDKVVPPESAKPLAELLPNVKLVEPDTGHLGLMASDDAPKKVWEPFTNWLKPLS